MAGSIVPSITLSDRANRPMACLLA
jgi:hypothetical protein